MKNKAIIFILGILISSSLMSQSFHTTIDSVELEIRFYNPATVRILKSPKNWKYAKESLSVVKEPQSVNIKTSQKNDVVSFKSDRIEVRLDLQ